MRATDSCRFRRPSSWIFPIDQRADARPLAGAWSSQRRGWASRHNHATSRRPVMRRFKLLLSCFAVLRRRAAVAITVLVVAGHGAAAQPACVGDCDGGGAVTINEIITMVNIALGNANDAVC